RRDHGMVSWPQCQRPNSDASGLGHKSPVFSGIGGFVDSGNAGDFAFDAGVPGIGRFGIDLKIMQDTGELSGERNVRPGCRSVRGGEDEPVAGGRDDVAFFAWYCTDYIGISSKRTSRQPGGGKGKRTN